MLVEKIGAAIVIAGALGSLLFQVIGSRLISSGDFIWGAVNSLAVFFLAHSYLRMIARLDSQGKDTDDLQQRVSRIEGMMAVQAQATASATAAIAAAKQRNQGQGTRDREAKGR